MSALSREPGFRNQERQGESPWTLRIQILILLWEFCWAVFCRWTPKPFWRWRLWVIRLFGARISGEAFIHQRARIAMPWNIELHAHSCIGDAAHLYSLAQITVGEGAIVAQESYLCCGSHDLTKQSKPLVVAPIVIRAHAFIGARAFILPGVAIGQSSVVGACSVVTCDVGDNCVVAGNPARIIGNMSSDDE